MGDADAPQAGRFTGGALAVAAAGTFLLPLTGALAGAIAGGSGGKQLLGAVAGMAVSLPLALAVNRWARRMAARRLAHESIAR